MPLPAVLNVKEPFTDRGGIVHPPAMGDGVADDTAAIQVRLDALNRTVAPSTTTSTESCTGDVVSLDAWDSWPSAIYFPAGIYRICGRLVISGGRYFRLFGDAGMGGGEVYEDQGRSIPGGAILRQDQDDEPIFAFESNYTSNWAIERLGFAWRNEQSRPDKSSPGAVGIFFGDDGQAPGEPNVNYYHGRISECWFRRGWRGIALDDRAEKDGGLGRPVALWHSEIDNCGFVEMRGSAVRLSNAPGVYLGMVSNTVRDVYVLNSNDYRNEEEQVRVDTQGSSVLSNLDLEGSRYAPVLVAQGGVSVRGVHLEHLVISQPYFRLMYFQGGPSTIDTFDVSGDFDAQASQPSSLNAYGSILHTDGPALTVSGGIGFRAPLRGENGMWLEDGNVLVVSGSNGADVRLSGAMHFPNPALPPLGNPDDPRYKFRTYLWTDYLFGTPTGIRVEAEPMRAALGVTVPALAAGASAAVDVNLPRAQPGDRVSLGPPPGLPAAVLFSGAVVVANKVQLRVVNTGATPTAAVTGVWTVAAGSGPFGGRPFVVPVTNPSEAAPPWPNARTAP